MAAPDSVLLIAPADGSATPTAWFSHWWIDGPNGLGIPTDFVNVWAAGKLALGRHPARARARGQSGIRP